MHTKIYGFLHIHRELLRYQLIGFLQVNMQKQHSSSYAAQIEASLMQIFDFFSLLYSLDVFCAFFAFFFLFVRFGIRRAGDMIQEPSKKPCEKYTNSTESIFVLLYFTFCLRHCFTAFKILFLASSSFVYEVRDFQRFFFMVMMIIIKTKFTALFSEILIKFASSNYAKINNFSSFHILWQEIPGVKTCIWWITN